MPTGQSWYSLSPSSLDEAKINVEELKELLPSLIQGIEEAESIKSLEGQDLDAVLRVVSSHLDALHFFFAKHNLFQD